MSDLTTDQLRERLIELIAFWRSENAGEIPIGEVEVLLKESEVGMSYLNSEQFYGMWLKQNPRARWWRQKYPESLATQFAEAYAEYRLQVEVKSE